MSTRLACILIAGVLLGPAEPAAAEPASGDLARIEAELARHLKLIEGRQREIAQLRAERDAALADIRGTGTGAVAAMIQQAAPAAAGVAEAGRQRAVPVGRPSPEAVQTVAVPPGYGVLTPKGQLVFDSALEYVQNSNPRLVFRGVEITPGIQLGVIEASDAERATGVGVAALRYGLTDRLEVEARAPYVMRHDRVTTLSQRDDSVTDARTLDGRGVGDVELGARFQINSGQRGRPVFIATSRIKTPTGEGPYEVAYDEAGIATTLATGSGFWGVEGGITVVYPSEPAVIYGGVTYLRNLARDIDRKIGSVQVGRVNPGDSIGAVLGFGLSLNPRLAVSFGYSHAYIFPTRSELGDSRQHSQHLQVGSLQLGGTYRMTERLTINTVIDVGITADAPDLRAVLRAPLRF
jgi:hypothetical protein